MPFKMHFFIKSFLGLFFSRLLPSLIHQSKVPAIRLHHSTWTSPKPKEWAEVHLANGTIFRNGRSNFYIRLWSILQLLLCMTLHSFTQCYMRFSFCRTVIFFFLKPLSYFSDREIKYNEEESVFPGRLITFKLHFKLYIKVLSHGHSGYKCTKNINMDSLWESGCVKMPLSKLYWLYYTN